MLINKTNFVHRHPDKNNDSGMTKEQAQEKFIELNKAYEVCFFCYI